MKKVTSLLFIAVTLVACKDEDKPTTNSVLPVMSFAEQQFDFGTIQQGDVVEHVFEFTNTGNTNLVIANAVGSCGCTVPEYPEAPVAPGESGEIIVKFNSAGKSGRQTKTVTITTNTTKGTETLTIKANITAG
jgi:uncharacterized protein DUF1573